MEHLNNAAAAKRHSERLQDEVIRILNERPMVLNSKDGLLKAAKALARAGKITLERQENTGDYFARLKASRMAEV